MWSQPRKPLSCRVQREAGAWHGFGALQVSCPPSQPRQPEPVYEQASPGFFLAAEPQGSSQGDSICGVARTCPVSPCVF